MIRRLLIFFGIACALALIVWGAFALLRKTPNGNDLTTQEVPVPAEQADGRQDTQTPFLRESENVNSQQGAVPVEQEQLTEEEYGLLHLGQFAKEFASRFGTYSNQNFARNLEEVLPFTTGQASEDVEILRKKYQPLGNEYVGVSSVAVALEWDADASTEDLRKVRVALRRIETRGSESEEYNQDLALTLIRSGDDWKVQTIQWGDRY